MGIRCADHVTPLYPQKLALTLPTGGGRSVGIVRSRTKATEFSFSLVSISFKFYFVLLVFCALHCRYLLHTWQLPVPLQELHSQH